VGISPSGIEDWIYGWLLEPPYGLSFPNFKDFKEVFRSINGIY
jgi:hypothetical protein